MPSCWLRSQAGVGALYDVCYVAAIAAAATTNAQTAPCTECHLGVYVVYEQCWVQSLFGGAGRPLHAGAAGGGRLRRVQAAFRVG